MSDGHRSVVQSGYDAITDEYLAWSSRIVDPARERFTRAFSARLPFGSKVLDLGCGAGIPSTRMLARRFAVTGVDLSSRQVAAAVGNVPGATFIQADLATVEFPERSFDGVTAFYVVSHVPRIEHPELFRRVAGWLRTGGLFLATLGAEDLPDLVETWLGRPMFFSAFDAATNRRLVEEAGFELLVADVVETLEPEGPVPFLWVLGRRVGAAEDP